MRSAFCPLSRIPEVFTFEFSMPRRRLKKARPRWIGVLVWLLAWAAPLQRSTAAVSGMEKKLIEYGWDVPTPAQMKDQLAAMEARPFDGLIFRLSAGYNAFAAKRFEPAAFAEDEAILRGLSFDTIQG